MRTGKWRRAYRCGSCGAIEEHFPDMVVCPECGEENGMARIEPVVARKIYRDLFLGTVAVSWEVKSNES